MTFFKSILLSAFLLTTVTGFAQATEGQSTFSIEIDPATFAFKGYGFHLRYKPKNSDHFQFGIGTYAMDMPSALVDFNKENKGKNWQVRINQGYGLFGEYHFSEVNKKWFVGSQLAIQQFKLENDNIDGNQLFTNGLLLGYGGYSWKLGDHIILKPWAGIGYTTKLSGEITLGNQTYDIDPMMIFAALHLGYSF